MERHIFWAYETFQYKPKEGTYCRRLLVIAAAIALVDSLGSPYLE